MWEFRIAAKKEDRLTNIKNGIVILVRLTASWIFSELSTKPGAINLTKTGMKISIIKTKNNSPKNNKLKISLANFCDPVFFFTNSEV